MKLAAVAEINFFDNCILQRVVKVDDNATWKDAYLTYLYSKEAQLKEFIDWIEEMPDDLNEARKEIVNGEMDVCVTFIEQGE